MKNIDITGVSGDAVRSRLPQSERLGFWSNTFVLWGFVLVVSSLLVGGLLGTQLPFNQAALIILLAGVFNTFVSILIGVIGTRTGYTSAMIYRYSYGSKGVIFPNFILSITSLIWFAVMLNITRDAFFDMFHLSSGNILFIGVSLLMALVFLIPAYKSLRWISYVDYLAVPAIIVIFILTLYGAIDVGGGLKKVISNSPKTTGSLFLAFTATAGGWLHGNTVISDFTRFYKNGRQAAIGLFLSYGILMVFQYIGATIGALATGEWNIFLMMERFGLLEIAYFAIFLGAWSTCMATIYFSANLMSAPPMPKYKDEEKTRKLVIIISWIIAIFFSWYGPNQIFEFILQFMSWVIGPIAVTVIIDYWLFPQKRKIYEKGVPDMTFNPAAYFGWIIGFLAGYLFKDFYSSLINGMLISGIIYYGWMKYALNRNTNPEIQIKKLIKKLDKK